MTPQLVLQLILRLLPSVVLLSTAYFVFKDPGMRERWSDLLFRAGSIRVEQKADPKIQNGIRVPFLALGILFLAWPAWYLWNDSYAQKPAEVIVRPTPVPLPTPTATPIPGTVAPVPTPFGTPPALPGAAPPVSASGAAPIPVQPGNSAAAGTGQGTARQPIAVH